MTIAAAQVFYLDPDQVQNAPEAGVCALDLYFFQKPSANGSLTPTGINSPGVVVTLAPTINSVPAP